MASNMKAVASIAIILSLNLLFFSMATSNPVPLPTCPMNPSVFGSNNGCLNLLSVLSNSFFKPPTLEDPHSCCSLFQNLNDLDASSCLCQAFKNNAFASFLGPVSSFFNIPTQFIQMLTFCGRHEAAIAHPCI